MKLSKKVLSMVLCGLVVLGGSQAALVKADAQTIIAAGDRPSHYAWKETLRFGMQLKGLSSSKSGWNLQFVHKDGHLTLTGPTNVGCTWTFGDTFRLGWKKTNGRTGETVFRTGSGSAGSALGRAMSEFNKADIQDGDKIYVYGEKWDSSVTFPDAYSMIKGFSGNDYRKGYNPRLIDKFNAAFTVAKDGLHEARRNQ